MTSTPELIPDNNRGELQCTAKSEVTAQNMIPDKKTRGNECSV